MMVKMVDATWYTEHFFLLGSFFTGGWLKTVSCTVEGTEVGPDEQTSSASVPNAPITIGITVTFMLQSFFSSLARSRYLYLFSLSFSFILRSTWTAKSTIWQVLCSLLLLTVSRSGRLAEIRWSVCILKFQRILYVSRILGCAYPTCSYCQI